MTVISACTETAFSRGLLPLAYLRAIEIASDNDNHSVHAAPVALLGAWGSGPAKRRKLRLRSHKPMPIASSS